MNNPILTQAEIERINRCHNYIIRSESGRWIGTVWGDTLIHSNTLWILEKANVQIATVCEPYYIEES